MKKLSIALMMMLSFFAVNQSSSALIIDGGDYCSDLLNWGPEGCDVVAQECYAYCDLESENCNAEYDSCIASCDGDTDCEASCEDDLTLCQENEMYCYDDCDYQAMECEYSEVQQGIVVGSGYASSMGSYYLYNLNLTCGNGGFLQVSWREGYNYYSFYVQNMYTNYCYENPPYEYGKVICGSGDGFLNGSPAYARWCVNVDEQKIDLDIDGNAICKSLTTGLIRVFNWVSPFPYDGYFDGIGWEE